MKAAFISEHGELDQLSIGEIDPPEIGPNDVLIAPKAAALNHLDLAVIKGWNGLNLTFPHIMGSDGAGIVQAVGSNVSTVVEGDLVTINPGTSCGKCPACLAGQQNFCKDFNIVGEQTNGTFAEQFKIPEANVLKIPADFPFDLAAAAPLVFLTAWRLLVTKAILQPGQIVVVQGASGGVATAAIQIAKLFGAKVIATTSTDEKAQKAQALGADCAINYNSDPEYSKTIYRDMTEKRGVDVVLDSVGTATFNTSLRLLRNGGKLVTCGATMGFSAEIDIRSIFWKQLEILGSTMSTQSEFRAVMKFVFEGKLIPVIDRIFKLDEATDAEAYLQTGNQFGKVLIEFE